MEGHTELVLLTELKRKSPDELYTRYLALAQEARKGVQAHMPLLANLADHGERHCRNVLKNLDLLLPLEEKQRMHAEELFLLLCAVELHGIGLLVEKDKAKNVEAILLDYPERTYDYLREHYDDWGLNKFEGWFVRHICGGLSTERYPSLPTQEFLRTAPVRVRFLAGLLRLADVLDDINYRRVSKYIPQLRKISPESVKKWLQSEKTMGVNISSKEWVIECIVFPDTMEEVEYLRAFVGEKLQAELTFVQDVLRDNGLYYRDIKARIPEQILEMVEARDAHLVQTLQRIYLTPRPDRSDRPYKFLDYFDPADFKIFFGRDADVQRFLGYITSQKLVVIFGESGVGKTSLINAGLVPKLIEKGIIPILARCYDQPSKVIKELTKGIVAQLGLGQVATEGMGLQDYLRRLYDKASSQFVIFIDQFEEFFVDPKFTDELQNEFIDELIECVGDPRLQVAFVLSLRQEYLSAFGKYTSRFRELFSDAHILTKLSEDEVEEAIVKPASVYGITYEDRLVKELVHDIYRGSNYNTPHIQIVCDRLFHALGPDSRVITLDLYEGLGKARKILADYLDAEISKFATDEEREGAKEILKELVTSHRTKTLAIPDEIALHTRLTPEVVQKLLLQLVHRCRLVRQVEAYGETTFELAHEFLVDRVGEWLGQEDIELKEIYEMIDRQFTEWERQGFLLSTERLNRIQELSNRVYPDEQRKAFILESHLRNRNTSTVDKRFWIDSLGRVSSIPVLIRVLEGDPNDFVYQEIVADLAYVGLDAVDTLLALLSTGNWKVRQGISEALLRIGVPCIPYLINALGHPDWQVRRSVIATLSRMGTLAQESLLAALTSPEARIRAGAAECLGFAGTADLESLQSLAEYDPISEVRVEAREAIRRIASTEQQLTSKGR